MTPVGGVERWFPYGIIDGRLDDMVKAIILLWKQDVSAANDMDKVFDA